MGTVKTYLTDLLNKELKAKGLCVWLDANGDYSDFVAELQENKTLAYPVLSFQGSFLELMLAMAPYFSGKDNQPCLIHMPGFNQKTIKETPVLEAYKAGKELQINLKTLVRNAAAGKLANDPLNHLLEDPGFSLILADSRLSEEDQTPDGLKHLISKHSAVEIALDLLQETRQYDALIELPNNQWCDAYIQYLHLQFGFNTSWLHFWNEEPIEEDSLRRLRLPLAAHLMCSEYVWDLKTEPLHPNLGSLKAISEHQYKNCTRVTQELRERHPQLYQQLAREIEPLIHIEQQQDPHNYGSIDTFAFEEERLLDLAFQRIESKRWEQVLELVKQRLGQKNQKVDKNNESFWVRSDNSKRWLWQWLELTTHLAQRLEKGHHTLSTWQVERLSPTQMTQQYTQQLYLIDQCHRNFEQWTAHLKTLTGLPHFSKISALSHQHRLEYRQFLNQLNTLFNQSCKMHGFLPAEDLRQRNFHQQVIAPMLSEGPTVVFYIDAFRYELGEELAKLLRQEKGDVQLSARLSELPSVTAVGMNALLPLEKSGVLTPAFDKNRGKFIGFHTGEKLIDTPKQREKLLREQVGLPMAWVSLKEMSDKSPDDMKKTLKGKQLVVVHSLEIDELGETGLLPLFPDYFEQTITRLLTVVKRLQQIDFQQFIFTSDHGFIQADETLQGERIPHVDVDTRRYILHSMVLESSQVTSVSLAELGYQVDEPTWLLFSPRVDLFQPPGHKDRFYHGGNSLQERVIPVIRYKKKKASRLVDDEEFIIQITPKTAMMGCHRIALKAERTGVLNLLAAQEIRLQLDTPPEFNAQVVIADVNPGVKQGNQIEIPIGQEIEIFFKLEGKGIKAPLKISRPDRMDVLKAHITSDYFDVISTQSSTPSSAKVAITETAKTLHWPDSIPEAFHGVLSFINTHGAVTESALIKLLGGGSKGSRQARRFAASIEDWLKQLPFDLIVNQTPEGKEYRKTL